MAGVIGIANTSYKASFLITNSIADVEVTRLVRDWRKTTTLCEAFLHSEARRAICTLTFRVATDSANGTCVLTSYKTGLGVAANSERTGRAFIMGIDDDVDIASIKSYSLKVSCLGRCFQCQAD